MKRPTGKFLLDTFFARQGTQRVSNRDLSGKLIVFTGGTDGMGRAAVDRFAEMGADICLLGRNPKKTRGVADAVVAGGKAGQVSVVECDLGSPDAVRRAAGEVTSRFERVDYIINCAGINVSERKLSPDGHEMNFAVNYLGPFLLTELLVEHVNAASAGRIVSLASATQAVARLDFNNLQLETGWSLLASYAQAKLCVIMHAKDLARRLEGTGTTIGCLNPGYIKSNLDRDTKGFARVFTTLFGGLAAPTWVGGERIVAAALDPRFREPSGEFIYEDIFMAPNPLAMDEANVTKLMRLSRKMTGLDDVSTQSSQATA